MYVYASVLFHVTYSNRIVFVCFALLCFALLSKFYQCPILVFSITSPGCCQQCVFVHRVCHGSEGEIPELYYSLAGECLPNIIFLLCLGIS